MIGNGLDLQMGQQVLQCCSRNREIVHIPLQTGMVGQHDRDMVSSCQMHPLHPEPEGMMDVYKVAIECFEGMGYPRRKQVDDRKAR